MLCCLPRWTLTWSCVAKSQNTSSFQCPFGSGEAITPDGEIVLADGIVVALDVTCKLTSTVIGNSSAAKEQIRRNTVGWGSLGGRWRGPGGRARTPERRYEYAERRRMGRWAVAKPRGREAESGDTRPAHGPASVERRVLIQARL